jgi:phosphoglycolate phosphatase-like HAD superfamily hydrolase
MADRALLIALIVGFVVLVGTAGFSVWGLLRARLVRPRAPRWHGAARRLRGVLLDVDGTLVDSHDAHARAWVDALQEHGRRVSLQRVRELIGKGGDNLLPEVAGVPADSAEGREIDRRRRAIFAQRYLPFVRPCTGARALLERLRREQLTVVVASSADRRELTPLLQRAGVVDLVDDDTSSDDADRSKPDSDVVTAALDRARLRAGDVVMIGDTPYDVEAARRSGIPIIALRCGGWGDRELAGATAIYNDPASLLEAYGRSPLGAAQPPAG